MLILEDFEVDASAGSGFGGVALGCIGSEPWWGKSYGLPHGHEERTGLPFIQIWVSACHFECELYTRGLIELLPFVPRNPIEAGNSKAPRRANAP
jgi:hypothetical protein